MKIRVTVPTPDLAQRLRALAPDAEIIEWDLSGPPPAGRLDVVVAPYMSSPAVLRALDGLDVGIVQSQSIGYDGVADVLPAGLTYCNAAGVHEASTAELAVGLMIASLRGLPAFIRAQDRGEWSHARYDALADKSVLIVGFGGVGRALEQRLRAFEVDAVPVASRRRVSDGTTVHGFTDLDDLVPRADVIVLAVPLNEQTTGMVDREFLDRMRPGALLVNVARGPVVDTDALTGAVRRGHVRAALDVTDPEPLPAEHPLWALEGALITPHVGGHSTAMAPRVGRLLGKQVARLVAGEAPLNVVLP